VDATGRDTLLANQFGSKRRNRSHNSAAVFSHFQGVERRCGIDEGNITIAWFDYGWFWAIPFKDGTTSVGAVCWPSYLKTRKTELDQFLWDSIALCPSLAERMKNARMLMPAQAAGNYSYENAAMSGPNFLMVGDSFAFIDPVFSSGVHLALNSAFLGAEVVDAGLSGSMQYPRLVQNFERQVRRGIGTFSWFIYRFTQPAFRSIFMTERNIFGMQEAVLSMLAGDVFHRSFSKNAPLFLFKLSYYLNALADLKNNVKAYQRRHPRHVALLTQD
jgi:flavin-dependent dehydrogenase